MDTMIESYQFVPKSGKADGSYATMLTKSLGAEVDMSPTRGGQIISQTFLGHEDGRYQWFIGYETMGGSWYESHIRAARRTLQRLAVTYASDQWTVLDSLKAPRASAQGPLPVSTHSSYRTFVRFYLIHRAGRGKASQFEHAVSEEVLPEVNMRIRSRMGHTFSEALLRRPAENRRGSGESYLWVVCRHSKIDKTRYSGHSDMEKALNAFESIGTVSGFDDFEVLNHRTA